MATTSFTVTDFTATGNEQILTNQAGAVQVVTNYFPYLKDTDVKVSIKAAGASSYTQKDIVSHWTINDSKNIVFKDNVLTASTVYSVLVRRQTNISSPRVTFQSGSAVSASDLNTNSTQFIYAIEELDPNTITATSEITIADDAVTTAKILDDNVTYAKLQDIGTANRVLGKASTGTVEEVQIVEAMIADNAVSMAKLSSGTLPTDIVVNQDNLASNSVRESEIQDGQVTTAKIGDDQITLDKLATAVANSLSPVGSVIWYAADAIPAGYLECSGTTVSRSTYSALFAVIGTTYGAGDGSSTFKVPDLRGEFVRGYDHGRGIDAGRGIGTSQSDEFKNHQHDFGGDDQIEGQGGYTKISGFGWDATSVTSGNAGHYETKNTPSNHGGAETRPRNIALLACIKY